MDGFIVHRAVERPPHFAFAVVFAFAFFVVLWLSSFAEADDPLLLLPLLLPFWLSFPKGICFSLFPLQNRVVIPTEATHSLIVSGTVEGPSHFAFAVVFCFCLSFLFVVSWLSSFAEGGGPAVAFVVIPEGDLLSPSPRIMEQP